MGKIGDDGPWPGMVVFDLDFTLWDCGGTWCDCLRPPFRRAGDRVLDAHDSHVRVYEEVLPLLEELPTKGCRLGLASRTERPDWAREILSLLRLRSQFDYEAIYPGDKQRHFRQLQRESGIAYEEMIFFDDEDRNIRSVGGLGVTAWPVERGVTQASCRAAIKAWRRRR